MKSVFITGAAQGIGLMTARHFAAQGWFVGLFDLNEQAINELLATPEFSNACGFHCDVTNRESIRSALSLFSEKTSGRMDALINNAGVLSAGRFEDINTDAHDLMIDVNVRGLTHVAELAFPLLKATPQSTLVNLCSASSVHGIPLLAVYAATKFYVNGLTQGLAIEWADHDIHVTSVKPPFVKTTMIDNMPAQLMKSLGADLLPETVAGVIFNVVTERKGSQLLGWKTKSWAFLCKQLPSGIRYWLMKKLTGF